MVRQTLILSALVLLTGCRGFRSEETPFHLNPNLDWQAKFKAQSLSSPVPEGVVAWGNDESFSDPASRGAYLKEEGSKATRVPFPVNEAVIKRGQERYNIYCGVCHDQTGSGNGIVVQRGFAPPPNLGDPRLVGSSDAYIYDVISNGIRNMPGYAKQISEEDRWAIVVYVRALQKVQQTIPKPVEQPKTPSESKTVDASKTLKETKKK